MKSHQPLLRIVAFVLTLAAAFAFVTVSTVLVSAQSGRRSSKPPPPPTPTPVPQATPVQKRPAAETKPALTFVVGIDRATFSNIPTYFFDTVQRACAERLDEAPSVEVDAANRDMNRGEATKTAKAETDSHVVWLQLRFDGAMTGSDDVTQIYIEYSVFAPTTAKAVTTGRSYQQAVRSGGVIVMPRQGGRSSLYYTEQLLKQAAREAANRILSAMEGSGRKVPG